MVLLQEEPEARGGEQDAAVEEQTELAADRDEVAVGDRREGIRVGLGEDALRAELLDAGDDVWVRAPSLPPRGLVLGVAGLARGRRVAHDDRVEAARLVG